MTRKVVKMAQKYFIDSWLLPCSLRSHRTANPRPKMGFAIFRLCPPTTLTTGERDNDKIEYFDYFCKQKSYICDVKCVFKKNK